MIINSLTIENYRSLKKTNIPLSTFSCIIGENNSGKSSTLLALSLFTTGSKIYDSNYYDSYKEITIEADVSITKNDLTKISAKYVESFNVSAGDRLKIVRLYDVERKTNLCFKDLRPKDGRFSLGSIKDVLAGTKGNAIKEAIQNHLPEYKFHFESVKAQKDVYLIIDSLIGSMNKSELEECLVPYTPAEQKILQKMFPTSIYIPAVKDVNDEVKTKETSTLGKIISVLLSMVENDDKLSEITSAFNSLSVLLNKNEDGTDERLQEIKNIEEQVNTYLNSNFSNAKLEFLIDPPSLKQVFSNTQVIVDDGVKNTIESKGDGLKRAVTFALLRTYVDLNFTKSKKGLEVVRDDMDEQEEGEELTRGSSAEVDEFHGDFLFLFEEPELYLHPSSQKVLFKALSTISKSNQVLVTTHSPIFFSSTSIGSFIKMKKRLNGDLIPYSEAISIDISNIDNKDIFQLICYENCVAAFFADKVILVEGDSDSIFLTHIAKKLNAEWNFECKNIPFITISGKGNIAKYKIFFKIFEIDVRSILDLDVLIKGFNKLDAPSNSIELHDKLIKKIDSIIEEENLETTLPTRRIRDLVKSYSWRKKYDQLKAFSEKICADVILTDDEKIEVQHLFLIEEEAQRQEILERGDVNDQKLELLESLRSDNIYVLSKGAIEKYYPEGVTGADKPSKALSACNLLQDQESVISISPHITNMGDNVDEFTLIFQNIFL